MNHAEYNPSWATIFWCSALENAWGKISGFLNAGGCCACCQMELCTLLPLAMRLMHVSNSVLNPSQTDTDLVNRLLRCHVLTFMARQDCVSALSHSWPTMLSIHTVSPTPRNNRTKSVPCRCGSQGPFPTTSLPAAAGSSSAGDLSQPPTTPPSPTG